MSVHCWSVNYLPTNEHLRFFSEMIASLKQEYKKPDKYMFVISGKFSDEASNIAKSQLTNIEIQTIKNKTPQYVGFKLILNTYKQPPPDYIIFMDGDDLISKDRTQIMLEAINKYRLPIITIASKFYENSADLEVSDLEVSDNQVSDNQVSDLEASEHDREASEHDREASDNKVSDYKDTTDDLIPMALQNNFITKNDEFSYQINEMFVSGEETSTLIIPFHIFYEYLTNMEDTNNYSDVEFYRYLVKKKEILFMPFDKPIYFYRIWDRPQENCDSLHHCTISKGGKKKKKNKTKKKKNKTKKKKIIKKKTIKKKTIKKKTTKKKENKYEKNKVI
jgi:hypothetical protein